MATTDIDQSKSGDMTTLVDDYSVDTSSTDGAYDQKETRWTDTEFSQNLAYYQSIPELKSTIDTKAKWVVGKGYKADKETKEIMDKWRGWGKDTANQLIQNFVRTYYVGGNSYAEIIREDGIFRKITNWFGISNPGKPVNLKPLDPAVITHVVNSKGMLLYYEQNSKVPGKKPHRIKPENMFHLAKNRFADEIHGRGVVKAVEKIILMRNEAMSDLKKVFHRYVKPLWIWKLNTDNATKIATFQAKADKIVDTGENIYVPMGAVEAERMSVPQFSTLDPLPWIRDLTGYFYEATNTPDIIIGSAKSTVEASAKILLLTFQTSVEDDQLFIIDNFKSQLGLDIKLELPVDIAEDLLANIKKEGENPVEKKNIKPGVKGKK